MRGPTTRLLAFLAVACLMAGCASGTSGGDSPDASGEETTVEATAPEGADILIRAEGCSAAVLDIPAERPPEITVGNAAGEPMVFTIPKLAVSLELAPGEDALLPLNPHLVGQFAYYCLDAPTHVAIGGHSGAGVLACPLDPGDLDEVARSRGELTIEQHARPGDGGAG